MVSKQKRRFKKYLESRKPVVIYSNSIYGFLKTHNPKITKAEADEYAEELFKFSYKPAKNEVYKLDKVVIDEPNSITLYNFGLNENGQLVKIY